MKEGNREQDHSGETFSCLLQGVYILPVGVQTLPQSSPVKSSPFDLKKGWSEKNTLPVNTDVMYECSTERHDSLTSIKTLFSFVTCLNPRLPWWLLVSLLMFSHTCLNLTVYRFCSYLRQLKSEGELVIYWRTFEHLNLTFIIVIGFNSAFKLVFMTLIVLKFINSMPCK